MFLTINNKVIRSRKWPNHASCPPLLLNVSWPERSHAHRRCASEEWLIFSTITRCYDKRVTVFAVAIVAGDSVKYQSFVYGSFVWEIHVRYNNKYLVILDLSRFSITFFLLPNQLDLSAHCSYHFSTSNVLRLRCNNTFIVLWRFQL